MMHFVWRHRNFSQTLQHLCNLELSTPKKNIYVLYSDTYYKSQITDVKICRITICKLVCVWISHENKFDICKLQIRLSSCRKQLVCTHLCIQMYLGIYHKAFENAAIFRENGSQFAEWWKDANYFYSREGAWTYCMFKCTDGYNIFHGWWCESQMHCSTLTTGKQFFIRIT